MRLVTAAALLSFKIGFVPLICRCYVFLYICLPFSRNFWEVLKHTLFASQKKREIRLSWVWYTILFFFSKAVVYWIPYYHFRSLLQEQRVSFFNWGILGFLSTISVHHLHNLAYLFIVLGFSLGLIWGSLKVLRFILSYVLPLIPACIIYLWQ